MFKYTLGCLCCASHSQKSPKQLELRKKMEVFNVNGPPRRDRRREYKSALQLFLLVIFTFLLHFSTARTESVYSKLYSEQSCNSAEASSAAKIGAIWSNEIDSSSPQSSLSSSSSPSPSPTMAVSSAAATAAAAAAAAATATEAAVGAASSRYPVLFLSHGGGPCFFME